MNLLSPLLDLLAPLLKRRDTYYVAAIAGLGAALWLARHQIKDLNLALAAQPKIVTQVKVQTETKVETHVVTKIVKGPERIVTQYKDGQVVERIVYRDPVILESGRETDKTTDTQKQLDKTVTAACPPESYPRWRYAGVLIDPLAAAKLVGLRGGVTLWKWLDVGAGVRIAPRAEGHLELGARF